MNKWFKRGLLKIYIVIHTWIIRISAALYNVEQEVLKADAESLDTKNKYNVRKRHRNSVLEKMLQGQRDEQYVQDYYEILKKADKFIRNASKTDIQVAADKHGMNLGQKDRWGRRYEHYGFFDPKHKKYGKTLGEAMAEEIEERSTGDDEHQVIFMFDNRPIEDGLVKTREIKETDRGYEALNEYQKAMIKKFPMTVIRDKDVANKIEQLTDFLHVKKIGGEHRLLEFFIQKKYKIFDNLDNKPIFDEITDIKQVWIKDEYDGKYGFTVNNYYKYYDLDDIYDVLKFKATEIQKLA